MRQQAMIQDSVEYLQAIEEYLNPFREQFNYAEMHFAFTNNDRFYERCAVISRYHTIEGANVLSSGCGFGGGLLVYRELGAQRAVGVEVEPDYARYASLRVRQLSKADVLLYDGAHLPLPEAIFDIIDSIQVIEHVENPQFYVDELLRVMKPGAICFLEWPNRLYHREQHTNVPFIHWLPKRLGDKFASALARWPWRSEAISHRLRVVKSISRWYPTLLDVRCLLRTRPVEVHYVPPHDPRWARLSHYRPLHYILPTHYVRLIIRKI